MRSIFLIQFLIIGLSAAVTRAETKSAFDGAVTHELGEVLPRRKVVGEVKWPNSSNGAREILAIEPGCDCLTILSYPRHLDVNQDGRIKFEFTGRKAGTFAIDVQVKYKATGQAADQYEVLTVQGKVADLAAKYLVSATDVKATEPVFIDVRKPVGFFAAHIPKSRNMPIFAVQTENELKSKNVVLVHDGASDSECLDRCVDLAGKGFRSVRVLAGGIRGWQLRGGKLEMTRSLTESDWQVDALRTPSFSEAEGGLVVYLTRGPGKVDLTDLNVVTIPEQKAIDGLVGLLRRKNPTQDVRKILFISSDGTNYGAIEKALPGKQSPAVFYLRGGLAALQAWRTSQAQVPQVVKISSSESVRAGVMVPITRRPGCSTCPK